MHNSERNRIIFHSKNDMSGGHFLSKSEVILKKEFKAVPNDINDVLELHNIKLYIDNEVYLKSWSLAEITAYKGVVKKYGRFIGQFISKINDENILTYYKKLVPEYINAFWVLINNQNQFQKIRFDKIEQILNQKPHQIKSILKNKNLVDHYNIIIHSFLLDYQQSAEIILSVYESKELFNKVKLFLPKSLTIGEKENIISNYIDSEKCNSNYLRLIQNSKKSNDLHISDKVRLKAKRKNEEKQSKYFDNKCTGPRMNCGVSIVFSENSSTIKKLNFEEHQANYTYSLKHIKKNNHPYYLYLNFKTLFEFLDHQNRINLLSKRSQIDVLEQIMGIRSKNEYVHGLSFQMSEMTSQTQIFAYSEILNTLNITLEEIIQLVYNSIFAELYGFANNANLSMPTVNISALEKIRILAPELESVLKQYKLYVEDDLIDFELLQMSSSSAPLKEIPSLNKNKYIYLNKDNIEAISIANLFFSDQTLLAYIEPFKDKHYKTFFELLINESNIYFNNYEEHQTHNLKYLLDKNYIFIDPLGCIQITNKYRVLILQDLHENEASSYHHYPEEIRKEAIKMSEEGLINFDSSLLSKPEQDYFNYYLNKSEFTNGLDLRNSYIHGTQANPSETHLHEESYLLYLKLIILILFKIEDDLFINRNKK